MAALAVYTVALGHSTLWSRDETTYASMARHMLRRGDWLTLWWNGRPWFNHPPFYFWLEALSFRMLGNTELAARLPSAVFGAAGVALTCLWGWRIAGPRAGLFSAACLGLSIQYFLESRMGIIDTALLFFLSLAIFGFFIGWSGQRKGYWLFFLGCGLAWLAKGPWGMVIPLVVVIPFAFSCAAPRRLHELPWFRGLALALLVGGSWYAVQIAIHGAVFARTVLGYYFLGRITQKVEHQGGPLWLYVPVILGGFLPWSLLLPSALKRLFTRRTDADRLLLCWVVIPFVGLTLAQTKLPSYAAFVYVPCALAVGGMLDAVVAEKRDLRWPFALGAALGTILATALRFWAARAVRVPLGAPEGAELGFTLLALGCLVAAVFARPAQASSTRPASDHSRTVWPVLSASLGTLGLFACIVGIVYPALEPVRSFTALCAETRRKVLPTTPMAVYGHGEYGFIYYADRGPVADLKSLVKLRKWISAHERPKDPHTPTAAGETDAGGVVVMPQTTYATLPEELRSHLRIVGATTRDVLASTD